MSALDRCSLYRKSNKTTERATGKRPYNVMGQFYVSVLRTNVLINRSHFNKFRERVISVEAYNRMGFFVYR